MNKSKQQPLPFTAQVERLSHEGRGIAVVAGKTTFIDNALPGETVQAMYTKRHARFDEAQLIELIQPSADRVEPPCAHTEICGGCSLQHMQPKAQIAFKQKVLEEQLRHFSQIPGGLQPKRGYLPPLLGPTLGYRRKARLAVKWVEKKSALLIGFREKQGRYVAELTQCEVLDVRVGHLIAPLKELLTSLQARTQIPQIEVAIGDEQVALVFRNLIALSEADQQKLIVFAQQRGFIFYLQPAGPESVHLLWPNNSAVSLSYAMPAWNIDLQFRPVDFIQVNAEMNQRVVALAVELLALQPEDRVLDLFCGLGNFTLPMAKIAQHVVGVEGDAALIEQAKLNAELNHLAHVDFHVADLFKSPEGLAWSLPKKIGEGFNKVLLDPPRLGAAEVMNWLPQLKAERIVYVSCNPATLARDLGVLCAQGYQLETAGVMDMFPHTTHVESIALLIKK